MVTSWVEAQCVKFSRLLVGVINTIYELCLTGGFAKAVLSNHALKLWPSETADPTSRGYGRAETSGGLNHGGASWTAALM